MSNQLFNELIDNNYLVIDHEYTKITKSSQKKGSPLDRYRTELLFFRHDMGCSYNDIVKWLAIHQNVHRSHTQVALRIQRWEAEYAKPEKLPTKKV